MKERKTLGEHLGFMNKKKVRHRKELNSTLMSMNTSAKRVTYLTIIQLPFDEKTKTLTFEENRTYRVSAKEYAYICDISLSQAYRQMKEGISELKKTIVEIPKSKFGEDLDFKDSADDLVVMFSVADYCAYSDGEGYVELRFHRKMKAMIAELERKYTTQYLLSAVRLPIGNANKLYLLLREKISEGMTCFFEIYFQNLKDILLIDSCSSYQSFKVFKNDFFNNSSKQIIKKTEFTHLEIEIVERVKRRAHKLRISYKYTEDKDSEKKKLKHTKAARKIEMEEKIESELRLFGHRWLNQTEAKQLNLNWKDGLTPQESIENLKRK